MPGLLTCAHRVPVVFRGVTQCPSTRRNPVGTQLQSNVRSCPAPASSEPSSESPADGSGDDAGNDDGATPAEGDVTAPGTKLKVGDRAVLPFENTSDKKGTIAVTVTAIEKGTEADMAAFGDKAKGMTRPTTSR